MTHKNTGSQKHKREGAATVPPAHTPDKRFPIVGIGASAGGLAVVVLDASDAITVQDQEGRITAWNPGAERLYGWTEAEALVMNVRDRIPQKLREAALATLVRLSKEEVLEPYNTQRLTKDGRLIKVTMISTALINETGQMYAIATTERATKGGAR